MQRHAVRHLGAAHLTGRIVSVDDPRTLRSRHLVAFLLTQELRCGPRVADALHFVDSVAQPVEIPPQCSRVGVPSLWTRVGHGALDLATHWGCRNFHFMYSLCSILRNFSALRRSVVGRPKHVAILSYKTSYST